MGGKGIGIDTKNRQLTLIQTLFIFHYVSFAFVQSWGKK